MIGEIRMFAGNFAPRSWAFCNGQLLSIAQNTALFSILGTTYGGNGQTTFGLPDLRGRVPVSSGQGPGLSSYTLGEQGGVEAVTLLSTQIPAHTHGIGANSGLGTQAAPGNTRYIAASDRRDNQFADSSNTSLAPTTSAGGSQPHSNLQPYLTVNFIIALQGIFPSRN